jgi:ABC-type sulfate transport system substrate-binding protein
MANRLSRPARGAAFAIGIVAGTSAARADTALPISYDPARVLHKATGAFTAKKVETAENIDRPTDRAFGGWQEVQRKHLALGGIFDRTCRPGQ